MRSGFLARRERRQRAHRIFWFALGIPLLVLAQYVLESSFQVARPHLAGTLLLAIFFFVPVAWLLRRTLVRWESTHLGLLAGLWSLYGLVSLLRILVAQGHALWAAGDAWEVLAALSTVRFPFAHVAPAVLLGPLLYAYARDAYALWGGDPRDALVKGYVCAGSLLVLPVLLYFAGAWWGAQTDLPHLWRWGSFRATVGALALAVGIAAGAAFVALAVETLRWRRLEARIVREGWA